MSIQNAITAPDGIVREAGFVVPVTISPTAWAKCVAWTDETIQATGIYQDQEGRLWDLLIMAHRAFQRADGETTMPVRVCCWSPTDRAHVVDDDEFCPPIVVLTAVYKLDDSGQPHIVISLPTETI